MKISNDEIYTPEWVADDMIRHFKPMGRILEPCKGGGVFTDRLNCDWCEIKENRDFFDWKESVDWIITNPPFSNIRKFLLHSFELSDNIVFLVPVWKVFLAYGTVTSSLNYGGMKEIRWYGTGSKLNFPMGNGIGAIHWQKSYKGPIHQTFYEEYVV
jgi:hypothetical protein